MLREITSEDIKANFQNPLYVFFKFRGFNAKNKHAGNIEGFNHRVATYIFGLYISLFSFGIPIIIMLKNDIVLTVKLYSIVSKVKKSNYNLRFVEDLPSNELQEFNDKLRSYKVDEDNYRIEGNKYLKKHIIICSIIIFIILIFMFSKPIYRILPIDILFLSMCIGVMALSIFRLKNANYNIKDVESWLAKKEHYNKLYIYKIDENTFGVDKAKLLKKEEINKYIIKKIISFFITLLVLSPILILFIFLFSSILNALF